MAGAGGEVAVTRAPSQTGQWSDERRRAWWRPDDTICIHVLESRQYGGTASSQSRPMEALPGIRVNLSDR